MASVSATILICGLDNRVKPWLELSPDVRTSLEKFTARFDSSSVDPVSASVYVGSKSLTKAELVRLISSSADYWKKRAGAEVRVRRTYEAAPLEDATPMEVCRSPEDELFMEQFAEMHSKAFDGATQAQSELVVLVDQYSHLVDEFLTRCAPRRFVCLPMIGPDGYGPASMKSGLVPNSEEDPEESSSRSCTASGPLFVAQRVTRTMLPNGRRVRITDTRVVEDDHDSGEEMGRFLDGAYRNVPASEVASAMRTNAVAARQEARQKEHTQELKEQRDSLEVELERLRPMCTSKDPLRVWVDDHEASLMTEVLRPNAHRVALIVGCEKLEAIARAAGVPGNVPAVRSIVDVRLMELITGVTTPLGELMWYATLARALLSHNSSYVPSPRGSAALVWTAQQLSTASGGKLDELALARKRHAAVSAASYACHRAC